MKKSLIIVLLITLFIFSCSSTDEASESLFKDGLALLETGQIDKAKEIFDSIGTRYPQSPYAPYSQAVYAAKEGLIYEAIKYVSETKKDHAAFLPALLLNAELALKVNRPEVAFFNIAVYQDKGGEKNRAEVLKIETHLFGGKVDDARNLIDSVRGELANDPLFIMAEADYYLHTGEYGRGLENCGRAVSAAPQNVEINFLAGKFFRKLGLSDSAACYFDKAIDLTPKDYYLKADIVEILTEMNYFWRAGNILNLMAQSGDKRNRYYQVSANLLSRQGRGHQAIVEYSNVMQKSDRIPSVLATFSEFYTRNRDYRGGTPYMELAVDFAREGKYPALAQVGLVSKHADLAMKDKEYDLAQTIYVGVLDSVPGDFYSMRDLTYLYWVTQRADYVEKVLNTLRAATQGIPEYAAQVGALMVKFDSLATAQEIIKGVLDIDKTNRTGIVAAIDIHRRHRALREAIAFLNGYDEYLSYDLQISGIKLSILEDIQDLAPAVQFAEKLIDIGKEDLSRYEKLAQVEAKSGNAGKIPAIFDKCIGNNPDNPEAYVLAGRYYFEKKDFRKAEELILQALKIDSLNSKGNTLWGEILAGTGRNREAIDQFTKVINIDFSAGRAMGLLAELLLDTDENPAVPLNHARRAGMFDPENPRPFLTQGRALYKMEKYQMATTPYNLALTMAADDPEINFYAGKNLYKLGKSGDAKALLLKAVNLGLSGNLKKEANEILQKL